MIFQVRITAKNLLAINDPGKTQLFNLQVYAAKLPMMDIHPPNPGSPPYIVDFGGENLFLLTDQVVYTG